MEVKNTDEIEIDVKELFAILLHKLWLILLIGILAAAAALLISKYLLQPVYISSTKVYVISRQDENKTTYSDIQTGTQLTKDYMILVKSRPVTEQVINDLHLNLTHEQLSDMIDVNTPQDTRILEISVKNHNADLAKKIVDDIAEVSSERMVSIMEIEKVNIVEFGNIPEKPASPNILNNTILGGIIGAIAITLLIIIINLLNDSIRTSDDIEKYLGITTLGYIPFEEERNRKVRKIKQRKKKAALAS